MLQAKILLGGAAGGSVGNLQEIPAFRNALKEHQERIRAEYEGRLTELERERENMEEEKAQVDRYKQLLLKQRDIMILLTQRLNERDEQIMALQDELDAYDRHQKEVEEKLDEKTAALIHLQRVALETDAVSPVRNTRLVEALGAWASPGGGSKAARGGSAAANAVPPSLLITTRQYKSHVANVGGDSSLLSAGEKIGELGRLLDGAVEEKERLGRQLLELEAEKSQMESMLKDRVSVCSLAFALAPPPLRFISLYHLHLTHPHVFTPHHTLLFPHPTQLDVRAPQLEKLVGAEIERRMASERGGAGATGSETGKWCALLPPFSRACAHACEEVRVKRERSAQRFHTNDACFNHCSALITLSLTPFYTLLNLQQKTRSGRVCEVA